MNEYSPYRAKGRQPGPLIGLFIFAITICSSGAFAQEEGIDPNPAGIQLQRLHPDAFVGGTEVLVTINVAATAEIPLFALGIHETPPEGWTFEGLYVDEGPQPDILPPIGATGVLEFGWVSPAVPVTMRYALRIPPADSGVHFFSGQVEYRLASDPKRNSAPVLTQIDGVADEAPVLSLQGESPLYWKLQVPFVDPGATALDKEEGDISSKIETTGVVNVDEIGTYTVTYGVLDNVGNRATPISRSVVITDEDPTTPTTPPSGGTDGAQAGGASRPSDRPMHRADSRGAKAGADPIASRSGVVPQVNIGGNKPTYLLPAGDADQKTDSATNPGGDISGNNGPSSGALPGSNARINGTTDATSDPTLTGKNNAPGATATRIMAGLIIALAGMSMGALIAWRRSFGPNRRRIHRK